jgi:hypothetical protein
MDKKWLEGKMNLLQEGMLLKLKEIRHEYEHKGIRGGSAEEVIREFLRGFLPVYSKVGQGEVIDLNGGTSTQIDIVITNNLHPSVNDIHMPSVYFIEGVGGVGEVKSLLNGAELERTLNNCSRFKRLIPEVPVGAQIFGNAEDATRFVGRRPFFLFAYESQLTLETITMRVREYNTLNALPLVDQIDGIFVLNRGVVINTGNGGGALTFVNPTTGEPLTGINMSDDNRVLLYFLLWLSNSIYEITSVGPFLKSYILPLLISGKED